MKLNLLNLLGTSLISTFTMALILFVLSVAAPQIAEARPVSTKAGCEKLAGTAKSSCQTCVGAGGTYENYKCTKKDGTTVECNLFECDAKVKAQLSPTKLTPTRRIQPRKFGLSRGTVKGTVKFVDILTKRTGSFGKKTFRHGQTLVVTKRDATSLRGNVCTFKLGYGTHATGDTGSKFLNKVKLFTIRTGYPVENYFHPRIRQQRTVLHFSNIKLKPVRQNPREPGLPTNFRISIGANLAVNGRRYVKESNYNNNVVNFKVVLNGDCRPRRIIKPGDQDRGPIHPN